MNIQLARIKITDLTFQLHTVINSLRSDILYKHFVEAKDILNGCDHLYELSRCYASLMERIAELKCQFPDKFITTGKDYISAAESLNKKISEYTEMSNKILDAPSLKILNDLSNRLNIFSYPLSESHELIYHSALNGISRKKNKPVYLESKGYDKVEFNEKLSTTLTNEEIKDLWLQRDEIDAVETFLIALEVHLNENDVKNIVRTARFAWDEARHHYYGLTKLAECGIDEHHLPYNIVGIAVRSNLEPLLAQAQIHLFGEVGIISRIKEITTNDSVISADFQWIYNDENMHVNEGVALLKSKGVYGKDIRKKISENCKKSLINLNIFDEEYISALDEKQLNMLIGE